MKPSATKSPLFILLLGASAGFAGLAALVKNSPQEAPGKLKPQFERPSAPVAEPGPKTDPKPPVKTPTVRVREEQVVRYVVGSDKPELTKEVALRAGEDPKARALAESLKSLGYGTVRVLRVDVENGRAMVDVSPGVYDLNLGTTGEAALIQGLALTLGQFEDVKSFRLRVDGEVVDSLGHLELAEGTPVTRTDPADESATPSRAPTP